MPGKVTLAVTAGPMQGRRFEFTSHDTFLFGRANDCHAELPSGDTSASRHHFLLEVNPPLARLRDLGSLNGTHVNGVRHGGRGKGETPEQAAEHAFPELDLHDGDKLRVGATIFAVEIEAPAVKPPLQPSESPTRRSLANPTARCSPRRRPVRSPAMSLAACLAAAAWAPFTSPRVAPTAPRSP